MRDRLDDFIEDQLAWLVCFLWLHRLPEATARLVLVMGIVGNIGVSLAWLGPRLSGGVHSYDTSSQSNILLAAVISNLAFLLIGLAPESWLRARKA